MNYLEQVNRALNFVEMHLNDDISLAEVAKEAGISYWHFARIFKALTNESLKSYIRTRRLSLALDSLLSSHSRIIEIAMDAGFTSQEAFTRAFKKAFNMAPNEARKLGMKNMAMAKIKFDRNYLRHLHQKISLEPEITNQKLMILVGKKTKFYSVDSDKNNIGNKIPPLWESFLTDVHKISNTIPGTMYGIIRQVDENSDLLEYFAGIAVNTATDIPDMMEKIEIPASRYAIFRHKGNVDMIDNSVNYIYSSWLFKSGCRHNYGPDMEIYGSEYIPNSDESTIYYAIPID